MRLQLGDYNSPNAAGQKLDRQIVAVRLERAEGEAYDARTQCARVCPWNSRSKKWRCTG
jgi:hypothetical protein